MTFPVLMLAATVSLPLAGAARLPATSTANLDPVWITVAAASSSATAKVNADFVCKGTNTTRRPCGWRSTGKKITLPH